MRRDEFEKMAEHLDDFFQAQAEQPDIRADLDAYVKDIGNGTRSLPEIIQCIESTEHAAFIRDIVEYLILRKEAKTNAAFIHGAHSAGKTQFLIRFGHIFRVEYYQ